MDCLFSRITNIHPHPNADKLDLGLVNNWPVVVPKGSFIENEIGLFICPDAKLPNNKVWAEPFLNYTGKENRVRTVKLRGEYSNGIFVKLKDLASEYSIHDEDLILDIKPEQVAIDLGIGHYSPPLPNDLAAGHRKTGLLAWVEDFFKKLTEILAGLLLNVPLRSMTINGMMFKNVHWICQKLLRRGVCL